LVSIGLVLSEEKIFEKVYDVRRTPSDGNSSHGTFGSGELKISHTKIKQPSFGEKRPKLTYTKISRFTVYHTCLKLDLSEFD
jgi:hypothetical protein